MSKTDKPFRPKARRPRGFEDKTADVVRAERRLIRAACDVYEAWGFEPLETPAFEYADALGKHLPDDDRPNEGVFALTDDDEQWMALRYDLTAPLARYMAENFDALPKPFRRYQFGSVWRNEKPGPGRFREFVQCDADSVGAPGPAADAEMIALAAKVMQAAGLSTGEYVVRVNDRRLLDAVLDSIGVPATEDGALQKLRTLRAIDKLDRLGEDGVALLLGEGRKDDSGDYTEGAQLGADGVKAVLRYISSGDASREVALAKLEETVVWNEAGKAGLEALHRIHEILDRLGVGDVEAAIDPSVVRGLGYYTGPVFEAELLLNVENDKGQAVRVGSVGGGGRYDDLVARFKGQEVPATGFSFGVSRFASALQLLDRVHGREDAAELVVVLALEPERIGDMFALADEIRAATGRPAEVCLAGSKNMAKQMKYADKRGAGFVVMVGSQEREAGQATIKDLKAGADASKDIESREEWTQERPGQVTVARGDLLATLEKLRAAR